MELHDETPLFNLEEMTMTAWEPTEAEFDRWHNWLLYHKGLPLWHANYIALTTVDTPEGAALFAEYVDWRP